MTKTDIARRDLLALAGLTPLATLAGAASPPPAQTPADRRRELYALLGDLPDRSRPIGGAKRTELERDGYLLETWDLDLSGVEPVPAYVARPLEGKDRLPAIVFNHSHGGGYKIGEQEFEGRKEIVAWFEAISLTTPRRALTG